MSDFLPGLPGTRINDMILAEDESDASIPRLNTPTLPFGRATLRG